MRFLLLSILALATNLVAAQNAYLLSPTLKAQQERDPSDLMASNIQSNNWMDIMTPDTTYTTFSINHRMTLHKLLEVKNDCEIRGLLLNYRELSFDSDQRLTTITIDVRTDAGYYRYVEAKELTDTTNFGIYIKQVKKGKGPSPFYVGYAKDWPEWHWK
jgi:hypothetical protein